MSEKTIKYIKISIVAVTLLFAMNRCTVACNRERELNKAHKYSIEYVDSIQEVLNNKLHIIDSINIQNKLLQQDTAYLKEELRSMGAANKALLERERTLNVKIK